MAAGFSECAGREGPQKGSLGKENSKNQGKLNGLLGPNLLSYIVSLGPYFIGQSNEKPIQIQVRRQGLHFLMGAMSTNLQP